MTTKLHQPTTDIAIAVALPENNGEHGRSEGEARKQERQALLRERRAVYVRRGQRALIARLLAAEKATADDVYKSVELPPGVDARCLGAVPGDLSRAGLIRSLGYIKSSRPKRHASPIQVWTLVSRSAAVNWLAANPDYPDASLGDGQPPANANEERPTARVSQALAAGRETESSPVTERTQSNG